MMMKEGFDSDMQTRGLLIGRWKSNGGDIVGDERAHQVSYSKLKSQGLVRRSSLSATVRIDEIRHKHFTAHLTYS